MTLLEINLTDVLLETDPDDKVIVWAPAMRGGPAGQLVGTRRKVIALTNGVGSDEVMPGPLMVQVQCKALSDASPREVVVPEEGPVNLTNLLHSTFTYTPAVVSQVALDAQRAEDAADSAEAVADAFGSLEGAVSQASLEAQRAEDAAESVNPDRFLPKIQSENHVVSNRETEITYHQRGLTLRGPTVEDSTENTQDRGARLTVHSSHGARNSNYGEGLRMVVDTPQSKNMIAWYDNFSDPNRLVPKAWFGYHYGTYPDVVHDHIAIETPKADGSLHSRFHISTTPSDRAMISMVNADFIFSAGAGGALRIGVPPSHQKLTPRDLSFETGGLGLAVSKRWAVRADTAEEVGGNAGSDLRIARFSDTGTHLGDVIWMRRSDGRIGFNTTDLSGQVNIERDTGMALVVRSTQHSASGVVRIIGASATMPVMDGRIITDSRSRIEIRSEGKFWWGDGVNPQDTNLYRSAPATLSTDHDFEVMSASRGVVLRDSSGQRYRLGVSTSGAVTATQI